MNTRNLKPSSVNRVVSLPGIYIIRVLGLWAIIYGIANIAGGPASWVNHIYDAVRIVPASPASWGVVFIIGGLFVFFGSWIIGSKKTSQVKMKIAYILRNVGLLMIGVFSSIYYAGIIVAKEINNTDLNYSVGLAQFALGVICLIVLFAKEPRYENNEKHK